MKRWIGIGMMFAIVGLFGCNDETAKEQLLEEQVMQLEQELETLKKQVAYYEEQQEIPEEIQPHRINLIDPNTSTVVKTLELKDFSYETDIETYIDEIETLAKELARGTETEKGYDQRMVLDRLGENGQVMKGRPMVILKESQLVEDILSASSTGGNIELPLEVRDSGYSEEDLQSLHEVVIGSYTTYFNAGDTGRSKNIELSAKAIHNTIVGNLDYFSFNVMVGPRTEETGYQPAPEIINAKRVMGIGGGICQTSSTLFNAIDQVPVTFVERHHHSLNVGYVPKGRDATVAYDSLDFRFQNTSGVPLLITTIYGKGYLTIEIRTSNEYEILLDAL
ncbi:VanW family protein [Lysinibacillus sp. 54212]|uniref:VanW family protein n=1 Tax=Lysinibacillus sp. 54212 TaxID=3119829 RepID=UPI003FA56C5E